MNINRISVFFERAIFLHTFWSGSFSRFPFLENGRGEKCFAPTLLVNVSGPFLYHDGHVHPDTFPF